MALRQTEQEQAEFATALQSIADQGPMSQAEIDSLSMLEGPDLSRFREVFRALPACGSTSRR
jgi:hypothetical protein